MSAPRIDTVRREVKDAIDLLGYLAANLEDLHELAYTRRRSGTTDRVRGGDRDYALDNHGNPKARELYDKVARLVLDMADDVVDLQRDVRAFLTSHDETDRPIRSLAASVSADEVVDAMRARRRRVARGEYEPHPIAKQTQVIPSMDWRTECEVLRSAVRKVTTDFAADHQHCQPPDEGAGRFKRKLLRRYPTKNLSTREREAWRAAQSVAAPESEKAS